jgi:hypothetical protein
LSQLYLKLAHLATQCGLCDVQRRSGARKAAQVGDAYEVFELFEIHTPFRSAH